MAGNDKERVAEAVKIEVLSAAVEEDGNVTLTLCVDGVLHRPRSVTTIKTRCIPLKVDAVTVREEGEDGTN